MAENIMENPAWKREIDIKMTYIDLLCLVGNLALSLRHPENTGPSSKHARLAAGKLANIIYSEFKGLLPPAVLREWAALEFIDLSKAKKCTQKPE